MAHGPPFGIIEDRYEKWNIRGFRNLVASDWVGKHAKCGGKAPVPVKAQDYVCGRRRYEKGAQSVRGATFFLYPGDNIQRRCNFSGNAQIFFEEEQFEVAIWTTPC
ncbi:hypothetical protein [Agrobacterium tumefaciens]|uniref:hypothetical protein n=1 Tax=Agrobacterium tumefaciens TaxID=358 RepID=UPI000DD4CFD4